MHRPDGIVMYGAGGGGHSILDVYCPSVTVHSHAAWARGGADHFMQEAQQFKRKQYDGLSPDHVMYPLVVSQFGAFSPATVAFIRLMHVEARGRVDEPSWGARHFEQVAEQTLSVAYWRSVGEYFGEFISRGAAVGTHSAF